MQIIEIVNSITLLKDLAALPRDGSPKPRAGIDRIDLAQQIELKLISIRFINFIKYISQILLANSCFYAMVGANCIRAFALHTTFFQSHFTRHYTLSPALESITSDLQ